MLKKFCRLLVSCENLLREFFNTNFLSYCIRMSVVLELLDCVAHSRCILLSLVSDERSEWSISTFTNLPSVFGELIRSSPVPLRQPGVVPRLGIGRRELSGLPAARESARKEFAHLRRACSAGGCGKNPVAMVNTFFNVLYSLLCGWVWLKATLPWQLLSFYMLFLLTFVPGESVAEAVCQAPALSLLSGFE